LHSIITTIIIFTITITITTTDITPMTPLQV
jgi:hypothetical protein